MRTTLAVLAIVALAAPGCTVGRAPLRTPKDKRSYCIGLDIAAGLRQQQLDVDPDIVARGIKDVFAGRRPAVPAQEFRDTMSALRREMHAKIAKWQEKMEALGQKNRKEGEAFLAQNKKKEGVVTLPSGLQYKVLKAGAGKSPKPTDTVVVHYQGMLTDGTEFEHSYGREPVTLPVNEAIQGWQEALLLMQVGAKWRLFVPSQLAYGPNPRGPRIGPHATLIFDLELREIK